MSDNLRPHSHKEQTFDERKKSINSETKKRFLLVKFTVAVALVFFGYFGFKYWQTELAKAKTQKSNIMSQQENYDNSESGIFDFSQESRNQNAQEDLADLTVNELKEKSAEFVYQMLIKNQTQIDDLRSKIHNLENEIFKYKNHEKIGKMIIAYVDLREKFLNGKQHLNSLQSFEILAAPDQSLQTSLSNLKRILADIKDEENFNQPLNQILLRNFTKLIPSLIANKNFDPSQSNVLSRIRNDLSRLITIRRIDGKNPMDVDGKIVGIEQNLRSENYQEALKIVLSFDQTSHEILIDFLNQLNNAIQLQKVDQEILNYLKSLT